MVQSRRRPRLAVQALPRGRVGLQGLGEELDRHLAAELPVVSQEHFAHAASTEALEDAVPGRGLAHGRCLLTEPPSRSDRADPHAETNPRMTPPVGISKWTG